MKVAIITSICGNKESLSNPTVIHNNADYYAFVDEPKNNLVWNQKKALSFSNDKRFANRRNAKIYKVLPELFIPNYDYYIWTDASIDVVMDPIELCEKHVGDCDYSLFKHRERNCIYDEANILLSLNYDHPELIEKEMSYFKSLDYPVNNGLYELPSFIKRKSDTSMITSLKWWEYICKYASRDQISLPVCLWESGAKINILEGHINGHMKNGKMEETRLHTPSGSGD